MRRFSCPDSRLLLVSPRFHGYANGNHTQSGDLCRFVGAGCSCTVYPVSWMVESPQISFWRGHVLPNLQFLHLYSMTFYLGSTKNYIKSLLKIVSGWLPRHVIGAVLVSLPAVSVFSHLACCSELPIQVSVRWPCQPPSTYCLHCTLF